MDPAEGDERFKSLVRRKPTEADHASLSSARAVRFGSLAHPCIHCVL